MTIAELVSEATRRVVERTGADALEVRDAIAHAVQVYVCELDAKAANDVRCDSANKCGNCSDCDIDAADERDEDGPDVAYERAHSAASLG